MDDEHFLDHLGGHPGLGGGLVFDMDDAHGPFSFLRDSTSPSPLPGQPQAIALGNTAAPANATSGAGAGANPPAVAAPGNPAPPAAAKAKAAAPKAPAAGASGYSSAASREASEQINDLMSERESMLAFLGQVEGIRGRIERDSADHMLFGRSHSAGGGTGGAAREAAAQARLAAAREHAALRARHREEAISARGRTTSADISRLRSYSQALRTTMGGSYGGYSSIFGGGGLERSSDKKNPLDVIRADFESLKRASEFTSIASSLDHPVEKRLEPSDLESGASSSDRAPTQCSVLPPVNVWCQTTDGNQNKYDGPATVFNLVHAAALRKVTADAGGDVPRVPSTSTLITDQPHSLNFGFNVGHAACATGGSGYARGATGSSSDAASPNQRSKKRRRVQSEKENDSDSLDHLLELLSMLRTNQDKAVELSPSESSWQSNKLDKKLRSQMDDPLTVLSGTMPPWVHKYMMEYPFLFSLKMRKLYLRYVAFGRSFAVHWMQQYHVGDLLKRRLTIQTELNTAPNGHRMQELSQELSNIEENVTRSQYWFGSLRCTLLKAQKGDKLLNIAEQLVDRLAADGGLKNMLEVQFLGETGFGDAVTKGFFVEICKALQEREANNLVPMWVEDGEDSPYLQCRRGLMIRPITKDHPGFSNVIRRYRFLGRCMGLALREGYLMPLPLTVEFFGLFRGERPTAQWLPRPGNGLTGEFLGVCADFVSELDRLRVTESQSSDMSIEERKRAMYAKFHFKLQFSPVDNIDDNNGDSIDTFSENVDQYFCTHRILQQNTNHKKSDSCLKLFSSFECVS